MSSSRRPSLERRTLQVSRGLKFSYYAAKSSVVPAKSTLLLLHGWPDSAEVWFDLAYNSLLVQGYGVIIPDMLGYGDTDKPLDPALYKYKLMIRDLLDILDFEGIARCIPLGHDWGAVMAQALYNWAPDRCIALAQLSVAYNPPDNAPVNVHELNERYMKSTGHSPFHYWIFNDRQDAPSFYEDHLDTLFNLCQADPYKPVALFATSRPDGVRLVLESGNHPIHPSATQQEREAFIQRWKRGGIEASLNWYRSILRGHQINQHNEDSALVSVPYLFIGFTDDVTCPPGAIKAAIKRNLVPLLTQHIFEGGHWTFFQEQSRYAPFLMQWLDQIEASSNRPAAL
jgi:soluble epoxide hydrolase/lipid-phosphate phosphatase